MYSLYKLEIKKKTENIEKDIYDFLDLYNGHEGYTFVCEIEIESQWKDTLQMFIQWNENKEEDTILALVLEQNDNVIGILYETEQNEWKWSNCMEFKEEESMKIKVKDFLGTMLDNYEPITISKLTEKTEVVKLETIEAGGVFLASRNLPEAILECPIYITSLNYRGLSIVVKESDLEKDKIRTHEEYRKSVEKIKGYPKGFKFTIPYSKMSEAQVNAMRIVTKDCVKAGLIESISIGVSLTGKCVEEEFIRL